MDATWFVEMDKFLKGEPNKLKEHKFYIDYNFEYLERNIPSVEEVQEVFAGKKSE
jgi:hypothetical protein